MQQDWSAEIAGCGSHWRNGDDANLQFPGQAQADAYLADNAALRQEEQHASHLMQHAFMVGRLRWCGSSPDAGQGLEMPHIRLVQHADNDACHALSRVHIAMLHYKKAAALDP